MVSRRSKLTVLCFILSCMYYLSMGETLIKLSYLILSYHSEIIYITCNCIRSSYVTLWVLYDVIQDVFISETEMNYYSIMLSLNGW